MQQVDEGTKTAHIVLSEIASTLLDKSGRALFVQNEPAALFLCVWHVTFIITINKCYSLLVLVLY